MKSDAEIMPTTAPESPSQSGAAGTPCSFSAWNACAHHHTRMRRCIAQAGGTSAHMAAAAPWALYVCADCSCAAAIAGASHSLAEDLPAQRMDIVRLARPAPVRCCCAQTRPHLAHGEVQVQEDHLAALGDELVAGVAAQELLHLPPRVGRLLYRRSLRMHTQHVGHLPGSAGVHVIGTASGQAAYACVLGCRVSFARRAPLQGGADFAPLA